MKLSIIFLIVLFFSPTFMSNEEIRDQLSSQMVNTFVVTNINDSGIGSLRQAILDANSSPGTDLVSFNIGTGPQSIALLTPLPEITDPIIIDGSTQSGYDGSPIIEITKNPNVTISTGLRIVAGNSTVKKIVINRFSSTSITLFGQGNNTIRGNYIGTDISGAVAQGGGFSGIQVENSNGNVIGGLEASDRNVISSAFSGGINFYQSNDNVVIGNYFGTDRFGNSSIPNGTGVNISSGNNNLIGGITEGSRNVVSGNTNSGVAVLGGSGNIVQGNYIGVKSNGTEVLRNAVGVTVWGGSNTLVGGSSSNAKNVISGNSNAVKIWGPETGNKLQGNYIGTDYLGLNPIPNTGDAITLTNPTDVLIGGEIAGEGNVVSGNDRRCVWIWSGSSSSPFQAKIQGNFFGVKADGVSPLGNGAGNGSDCIMLSNLAKNVLISGNVIANNSGKGVYLNGSDLINQVTIRRNRFFDNAGLGISFRTTGVSTNDFCDSDNNYPNGNQNYPTITSARILGNMLQGQIVMWDAGGGNYEVDVFGSESCDISGYGEGKFLLGSFAYSADGSCQTQRNITFPIPNRNAMFITATLTDPNGNTSEFSPCFLAKSLSVFDFDGDSKTDISIYRPSNGQWWLNRSSDGLIAATFGQSSDLIAPDDFTGDGKTDIAFWRPSTGQWFVLRSEDSSFFAFPFGTSGDVPVPADYDGDGRADAAVFRPSNSTWYVLRSSGGTSIVQFGAIGDKPVAADYDGDGKSDIAIWRANGVSGAEWWYQKSSNNQVAALQFGSSTDKAVPGDYTGDGKADIAFFQPNTGFWYILRSEDFSFFAFPFGQAGDVPAPGDYDGDGKFDAAVFRPSNSTWFVNRTTAGVLIQQFGATGDQPVPAAFVP